MKIPISGKTGQSHSANNIMHSSNKKIDAAGSSPGAIASPARGTSPPAGAADCIYTNSIGAGAAST